MVKMVFGANGGQSFVKIMKNNGDDPITTPDTDYGKFLFNSNNQNLGYVLGIRDDYYDNPAWTWATGFGAERSIRFPIGASWGDAEVYAFTKTGAGSSPAKYLHWYLLTSNVYGNFGDDDFAPFMDYKVVGTDGRWTGASVGYTFQRGDNQFETIEAGSWYTSVTGHSSGFTYPGNTSFNADDTVGGSNLVSPVGSFLRGTSTTSPNAILVPFNWSPGSKWNVSVWDIPGNNMPMNPASPTPIEGQEVVRLNSAGLKMARKGFTVDDTDPRRFIVNTSRIPAKVMRTGTLTLSGNSYTDITTPLPVNDRCIVDMMVKGEDGRFLYPPMLTLPTSGRVYQVVYEFVGTNTVRIRNLATFAVEISYIILADDGQPQTTGGTKVFRREPDYIQIKKPGSSDTAPALSDIVLDTRLASLHVAAEGYIPHTDMTETPTRGFYGNLAKSIYFSNDGTWRPFVKYTTVYDVGGGKTGYKLPQTRFFFTNRTSPYVLMPARQSSVAEIYDNRVKFHLTRDNPYVVYPGSTINGWIPSNFGEPNPIGIRYYIFAIPNTL